MENLREQNNSGLVDISIDSEQIEGTAARFSKWLVEQGASVKAGDPLLELETDKVAMEVAAPADGILFELLAVQDQEVTPEFVLGRIQTAASDSAVAEQAKSSTTQNKPAQAAKSDEASRSSENVTVKPGAESRNLVGPAVRRLARENNLDLDKISGSGRGGRVTRDDVLRFLETQSTPTMPEATPSASTQLRSRKVPHSNMRKAIARHMVDSLLETSPHVTSVFEMNMSNVIEHRRWHKKEYAEQGVKLTFTAYFLAACVAAMREVPEVNARYHDDHLEIIEDVNIGVGTALGNKGLIVPVIPKVQELSLFKIAEALQAQTEKARSGNLVPADMRNGTFTISNHGTSGSLFAAPIIINQPQVAILGVGKLEKRVVVETINGQDEMIIKPMCYVSLSIDHRALDAYQTNLFLAHFVQTMEEWGQ